MNWDWAIPPGFNILGFGGKGDGTTDNTAAFNSAAALLPSGGNLYFHPGKFKFNSSPSYTYSGSKSSLTIVGAGADDTTLFFPSGDGITLNASSAGHTFHFRDLTLTTGSAGSGSAIVANNSVLLGAFGQNDITRVTIRGDDGYSITDYWSNGIVINGFSNVN